MAGSELFEFERLSVEFEVGHLGCETCVRWRQILEFLRLKYRRRNEWHKVEFQVVERSVLIGVGKLLYSPLHHPEYTVRSDQLN